MRYVKYPPKSDWPSLLKRPTLDTAQLEAGVNAVLQAVRQQGDAALKRYTLEFDKVLLEELLVQPGAFAEAEAQLAPALKAAMQTAYANIRVFHEQQRIAASRVETMPGVSCWRKSVPIEKVGLYIPGGTAPLFSTVLMLGIPAQIAGCSEIILCTPPQRDGQIHPAILHAAQLVGVTRVVKAGGAQAIGALAYGTESVPQVYKIFGPGNQYVTAAKQIVSRDGIAIDMPAGPSEVLVCADDSANPAFVAADLLSQAEHGADSQVVLVAFSEAMVTAVQEALQSQLAALPRRDMAAKALDNSLAVVVENRESALELINAYAPEHLILSVGDPEAMAEAVINAGSVFLGHYTPESVGDYASGTNHTLPTNGYARAYSGVSLDAFVKKITFQQLSPDGLLRLGPVVAIMAEAEQLAAHGRAVAIRLEELKKQA